MAGISQLSVLSIYSELCILRMQFDFNHFYTSISLQCII
uniref:Uncharacterized protein n=1 Tax=Anguilla anguilla TaxID=7936 RepID=A0A0E9VRD9_ANGAN